MSTPPDLRDIRVDAASLYREDVFSDRRVGTIRRLVPVTADGSDDPARPVVFEGQMTLLTPAGSLPLSFEIEARSLQEAVERFPAAAQAAVEQTLQDLEELRREAASSIVVPGRSDLGLGNHGAGGLGGIGGGGRSGGFGGLGGPPPGRTRRP